MNSRAMRNVGLLGVGLVAFCGAAHAQLYGVNPFENNPGLPEQAALFHLDVDTGAIVDSRLITVPSRTITGANSITVDPTTGVFYAITKASGVSGRLLITLDVATGEGVEIGNLGDNFSSLTFDAAGQLYGVTGDGATVPESLYAIDKATAATTLLTALGNGADGEVIAFNPEDGLLYHWSGNATLVFESVDPNPPHTVTGIFSGAAGGEVFGATWDGCRQVFLAHDINSQMASWSSTGVRSDVQPTTLTDVRGLALVGGHACDVDLSVQFAVSDPVPTPGAPVTIDIDVTNSGPARARANVVAITLFPELTFVSSTGCAEDPTGVPTCSVPQLFAGETHSLQIEAVYTGGTGRVIASVTTDSDDTEPANDVGSVLLGPIATVTPTSGLATTEVGGAAGFTVVLNAQPTAAETLIPVSSSDPSEGVADTAMLSFTNADWEQPQTVAVIGIDDLVVDGDVAYTIVLGPAQSTDPGFDGGEVDDVAVVNQDDDVAGAIVSPTSGLQTTEAGGSAMFGVALTSQPGADVSIGVSSSDPGEGDVSTATLLFTDANWNDVQFVTVTGVDDAQADGDIAYTVILAPMASSDMDYDGLDPEDASVVNLDDDVAGVIVAPTSDLQTTEAGGSAMFGVVLTSQPGANVSIGVTTSDPGEGDVSTATLLFTDANWNVAQMVTVTGVDDVQVDGDIAYTVILAPMASSDMDYNALDPEDVSVVNLDDDFAELIFRDGFENEATPLTGASSSGE